MCFVFVVAFEVQNKIGAFVISSSFFVYLLCVDILMTCFYVTLIIYLNLKTVCNY